MSADFWSGYLSGAAGILIGNPFDVIKVRLQAIQSPAGSAPRALHPSLRSLESLPYPLAGAAAPILGYGALNALLFVSYNRTEAALTRILDGDSSSSTSHPSLLTTWLAGATAGLATWAVSTPTELVKCRAQLGAPSHRSWDVARSTWRAEGLRGLYLGGAVTALRDSLGYGFYFWTYAALTRRLLAPPPADSTRGSMSQLAAEAPRVLLAGGLSGIATWASIYPLDVVKTRVQAQVAGTTTRLGAWAVSRQILREEGWAILFRGLGVCSLRAFVVNAVQWGVYELAMYELGEGRWGEASL